jgi:hypothetical protein
MDNLFQANAYWSVKIVLRDRAAGEQGAGIEKLIVLFLI